MFHVIRVNIETIRIYVKTKELFLKGIKECSKFVKISTIAVLSRYNFYQCHETSWNKKENNENLKIFKISMQYAR